MANYSKSFNFRNGVQVDNDNFIVSPFGLVGIGTSLPTQLLDVNGNANVNGLVNAVNLKLTGISTLSETRVGSGITLDPTSGIITAVAFYGNGATLSNLPTSQWVDVDAGLGFTSIYAAGNVGIATVDPRFTFQVGGQPGFGNQLGVGINSTGGMIVSGILTSYSGFSGPGLGITQLNADYIVVGTLSTSIIPPIPNVLISRFLEVGIVTATSGFIGDLTGNVSGNTNGNFVQAGIITASNIFQGNIAGVAATITYLNVGILTASTNIFGSVTGQFFGNLIGSLTGVADSARALTGGPNIFVNNAFTTSITNQGTLITGFTSITSAGLQVGNLGNYFTVSSTGSVGIGTSQPTTSDLQIRKSTPVVEIISNSGAATLSIGNSVGLGASTGILRFGATSKNFDIVNNDIGNFNMVLHGGPTGFGTGRFAWVYGQNNFELASLTYQGNLGLGITNPSNTLHVVGTSTVTGTAYFGSNSFFASDVIVAGTLTPSNVNLPPIITNTNIYNVSGLSTFYKLHVVESIGINTSNPQYALDAREEIAVFGSVGIDTTETPNESLVVGGSAIIRGNVGIGTTLTDVELGVYGNISVYSGEGTQAPLINIYGATTLLDNKTTVGVGTTAALAAVDFSSAGYGIPGRVASFMIVPRVTTTERTGLTTQRGGMIFNTTTLKFQGWDGTAWRDFH